MITASTLEETLQKEWLKFNKPNAYFDTVTDKRVDKNIGREISYLNEGKAIDEVIVKRRSTRNALGNIEFHYFTISNKIFTLDELEQINKNSA